MARKKPTSGKARKVQLLTKRAIKASKQTPTPHPLDELLPSIFALPTAPPRSDRISRAPPQRFRTPEDASRDSRKEASLKIESRFLRLPLVLLDYHRKVSATAVLKRPISSELGVLRVEELQPKELEGLTCPGRPKWSYNSTKKEVEKNEEGVFIKWLVKTDSLLAHYAASLAPSIPSPTFFERNLNVWRQLWRVSEISAILLILIDVRFPLIHYPPSLETYVKSLRPKKRIILVLTKTDLVPRHLSEAWKKYLEEREGPDGAEVVLMEAYREAERTVLTQGTQPRFLPSAPPSSRQSLLGALRRAHNALLTPPPIVASDPEKLKRWQPKVRRDVDWDSIVDEVKAEDGVERKKRRKAKEVYVPRRKRRTRIPGEEIESDDSEGEDGKEEEVKPEPEPSAGEAESKPRIDLKGDEANPYITIGLIGQPNVGKSSLLNALLGKKVVRASRTPGKTKTFQTIFWNPTLRLCDCPGLVCPSFAGMERQVLAGLLPIQSVEPVLSFIAQRMPLEKILKLEKEDERDVLAPSGNEADEDSRRKWTADDLLSSYAEAQGFITAKAGRPDLYRAGAYVLRQLHSSAIPWAFRPPFEEGDVAATEDHHAGIWIRGFKARASTERNRLRDEKLAEDQDSEESESGSETSEESNSSEDDDDSDEGSEEDAAEATAVAAVRGAFAALEFEAEEDEEGSKSESSV